MSTLSRREFVLAGAALALGGRFQDARWAFEHFAMDTWFWGTPEMPIGEQAGHLRRAGYTGMALSWGVQHRERLAACKEAGLSVPGIYTVMAVDDLGGPAWMADLVAQLKGSDALVWLSLTSKSFKPSDPAGDGAAMVVVTRLAGLLQDAGLPGIAFYPHVGAWLERVGDGVRLAAKSDRKDVGTMFNQYHWMAVEGGKDLRPTLEAALPRLRCVSINGSAGKRASILPLGEGDYDTFGIVKMLSNLGFKGPIGSQGYGIKGRVVERLEASKRTWSGWLKVLSEGN